MEIRVVSRIEKHGRYEWQGTEGERRLVPEDSAPAEFHDPLTDSPAMFYEFASLEQTEASFCRFSEKHGLLVRDTFDDPLAVPTYEHFTELHRRLHASLHAWRITRARTIVEAQPAFTELARFAIEYHDSTLLDALAAAAPSLLPWPADDTNVDELAAISSDVTLEHLAGIASAFLTELLEFALSRLKTQFGGSADDVDPLHPTVIVGDLRTVIFLQLAEAVRTNRLRVCQVCGEVFQVGTGRSGRVDKVFCSQKCQLRAHYQKKVTARQMRADGVHLRTIAKQLGANVASVRKWLGE